MPPPRPVFVSVEVRVWDTDEVFPLVAVAAPEVMVAEPVAVLVDADVPVPGAPTPCENWPVQLSCQNLLPATLPPVFDAASCAVWTRACWPSWLDTPPPPPSPGTTANADAASASVAAPVAAVPMMSLRGFKEVSFDGGLAGVLVDVRRTRPRREGQE